MNGLLCVSTCSDKQSTVTFYYLWVMYYAHIRVIVGCEFYEFYEVLLYSLALERNLAQKIVS